MKENVIKSITLDNGLKLDVIDQSRKIAGDRFFVRLVFRVEVPVDKRWFKNDDQQWTNIEALSEKLGDAVIFEQKHVRHFVDEGEKDALIAKLCDSLVKSSVKYFALRQFPQKFILKKYTDMVTAAPITSRAV